jgi:sugar lactone lactonase YvrE
MDQATVIMDGFTLTEAPRWHDGRIWFDDLYRSRVCSATEAGSDLRVEAQLTSGIPVGLGWLPDGRLVVVVQDERRIMRREPDGSLVQHADLSQHAVGFANDLAMTQDGVAYVGCFGFDLYAEEPVKPGPLMRVTPDGEVSVVGEPLYFANGPTIIDGKTLVIAESFANRLSAFDILPDKSLSARRDWATFGPLPTTTDLQERYSQAVVAADGISAADAEGAIWVADFTRPLASRVMPGGKIVEQVSTGDLNCFAAALGGADGRTLFLCGAPAELDMEIRRNDPKGAILTYRVPVPVAVSD